MNDRLIVLGTGNANVTHCYNTCFAIDGEDGLILCDAGGGSGILQQRGDRYRAGVIVHRAGFDTEAQELLKHRGFAQLYAKDRRDAIIIYGLTHDMTLEQVNDSLFTEKEETLC